MRHQTVDLLGRVKQHLLQTKWNLVVMAACCFIMAAYNFVVPASGVLGVAGSGLDGVISALPVCGIVAGALSLVGSFASKSTWVLSWVEVAFEVAMFALGFWGLFFPTTMGDYAGVLAFAGVFAALYLVAVSLEMDRMGAGRWVVALCVAVVVAVLALALAMGFAGVSGAQGVASLMLFVAAWGFVYGAVSLQGVGSVEDSIAAPVRLFGRDRA
ncbi:MAG TPA: hypothetical protein K8U80_08650 [Collinsella ihuae]|uniref:Uncharacterized protein n=1 Tax=Collinsella ihumii TaxID=1720204 RepID=A0A921ISZ6_9ACTN|nr:hypothetical protein [Collinsella ihumii]